MAGALEQQLRGVLRPDAQMEPHETSAMLGIVLAVIMYGRLKESFTPEMKAWEVYMTLLQPEVWDSHPDPGAEGYDDFKKALDYFTAATRPQRAPT